MAKITIDWKMTSHSQSDYPDLHDEWLRASWTAIAYVTSTLEVIDQFPTSLKPDLWRDKNAEVYTKIFSERFPRRDKYVRSIYQGILDILNGSIRLVFVDDDESDSYIARAIDHDGNSGVVNISASGLKLKQDGDESKALILIHELAHVASYVAHKGTGKLMGVTDNPNQQRKSDRTIYNPKEKPPEVEHVASTYQIENVFKLAKENPNYTYKLADAYRCYIILGMRADFIGLPVNPKLSTGAIPYEGQWTVAGDNTQDSATYYYYPGLTPETFSDRKNPTVGTVRARSSSWFAENGISRWLDVPEGHAMFSVDIHVDGDPNKVFLLVCSSFDDNGEIYLNNPGSQYLGGAIKKVSGGHWGKLNCFYVSADNGLVHGRNTLWFHVHNTGGAGGLRVQIARHPAVT